MTGLVWIADLASWPRSSVPSLLDQSHRQKKVGRTRCRPVGVACHAVDLASSRPRWSDASQRSLGGPRNVCDRRAPARLRCGHPGDYQRRSHVPTLVRSSLDRWSGCDPSRFARRSFPCATYSASTGFGLCVASLFRRTRFVRGHLLPVGLRDAHRPNPRVRALRVQSCRLVRDHDACRHAQPRSASCTPRVSSGAFTPVEPTLPPNKKHLRGRPRRC